MSEEDVSIYKLLSKGASSFFSKKPEIYFPTVTQLHYSIGFIDRYFVKPANDSFAQITEVTEIEFLSFNSNPFYKRVAIRWKITGSVDTIKKDGVVEELGVGEHNYNQLKNASEVISDISNKLSDLYQFYKSD